MINGMGGLHSWVSKDYSNLNIGLKLRMLCAQYQALN